LGIVRMNQTTSDVDFDMIETLYGAGYRIKEFSERKKQRRRDWPIAKGFGRRLVQWRGITLMHLAAAPSILPTQFFFSLNFSKTQHPTPAGRPSN
jgi:hypothetical protein